MSKVGVRAGAGDLLGCTGFVRVQWTVEHGPIGTMYVLAIRIWKKAWQSTIIQYVENIAARVPPAIRRSRRV